MSNVEHYFENLLFNGKDCKGEPNKNSLSKEVQEAVEECAQYIKYSGLLKENYKEPKSEWEHDYEILKAQSEGAREILDIIRAEIEKYKSSIDKAISEDELKIEGMKEAYTDCLEIIDEYKE